MSFSLLPKVELHLHLDCSLSYEVVREIEPGISQAAYRDRFTGPVKCQDLNEYLRVALAGIALMQTPDQLQLVTHDVVRQLKADGLIYAEIRFAPFEHTRQGMKPYQVVELVCDALAVASRQYGLPAGLILCTQRHYTAQQSMETARLAHSFSGRGVVGFDIAGDEAGYPVDGHIAAFQYAREHGVPCTAHAGEARGADSVREVLNSFQPQRIGHGVRSVEDEAVMQMLRESDIHLEICPTSNIQTNVYPTIEDHPADRIYRSGISIGINTDSRAISDTTLTKEYHLMAQRFGWGKMHLLRCNLEAVRHAFASEALKKGLREELLRAYINADIDAY